MTNLRGGTAPTHPKTQRVSRPCTTTTTTTHTATPTAAPPPPPLVSPPPVLKLDELTAGAAKLPPAPTAAGDATPPQSPTSKTATFSFKPSSSTSKAQPFSFRRLFFTGLRLLPFLVGGKSVFAGASPTTSPVGGRGGPGSPPATANAKLAISAAARVVASSTASSSTSSSSVPLGAAAAAAAAAPVTKAIPVVLKKTAVVAKKDGGRLMDDHSLVKLLFLIVGLFWVLLVLAFLYWAPVVTFLNLGVLAMIVVFIKSEGATWHHAQESENQFWTVMAFLTSMVLIFSPDSPLGIGQYSTMLGFLIAFSVAFAVHSYDRHLHRVNISRKPEFVRVRRGGSTMHARGVSSINNSTGLPAGSGTAMSPPGSPPTAAMHQRPRAASSSGSGYGHGQQSSSSSSSGSGSATTGGIATAEAREDSTRPQRAMSMSSSAGGVDTTAGSSSSVTPRATVQTQQPQVQQQQAQHTFVVPPQQQQAAGTATGTSSLSSSGSSDSSGGSGAGSTSTAATTATQQQLQLASLALSSHVSGTGGGPGTNSTQSSRPGSPTGSVNGDRAPGPRLLGILLQSSAADGERVADAVAKSQMEEKLEVIEHALKAVDQYISSSLTNWFNMQKVLRFERTIINIFNLARTDELNFLVSHVTLALLFYKVKDHILTSAKNCNNRTDLIEVLAVTRISELGIPERAMVLDALQQMKLTAHPRSELWVRNILLCTLGDSLSELKSLMDAKGDFQSLHKLVFDDIRTEKIRNEILVHIRKQAQVQAAHMKLGTRLARQRRERQPWRKVLSDVDDTLASSGGRFPAGIDRRFPRHALYPGVLAFYRELDLGTTGPDEWGPDRDQGNLVFLSARPHLYKDVSEKHSYAKFRKLQEKRGMHTTPTLLAGSLDSGYNYVMERNIEGLAQKKMENFEQFVSLYPEYSFVFIGDNGQGDLRAAELMAKKARLSPSHPPIDALYIHRIQALNQSYGYDEHAFNRWRAMGICFFDNYIEAAMDAATRRHPPLIRMTGLRRVVEAAVDDFFKVEGWGERDMELRRVEVNRSILRANDILTKHGLHAVPTIVAQHKSRFEVGVRVMTMYGSGVVRRYRTEDGVYELVLDWTASPQPQQQPKAGGGGSVTKAPKPPQRLSLGTVRETSTTPVPTPLSISPPRLEYRARSESVCSVASSSGPPSPLLLPSPLPTHFGTTSNSAGAGGGATTEPLSQPRLSSDLSSPGPVYRSASSSATCSSPTTQGRGGVSRGVPVAGRPASAFALAPGGSSYKQPPARTPIVAYLQDSAIMYAVPTATPTITSTTTTSSKNTGLSSYISFFPGASYLSRLRSERGPRFPPGTYVETPYGAGVVLKHRAAGEVPVRTAPPSPVRQQPPQQAAGEGAAVTTTAPNTMTPTGTSGSSAAPGGAAVATATASTSTTTSLTSVTATASKPAPETYVVELRWGAKAYLPASSLSPAPSASVVSSPKAGPKAASAKQTSSLRSPGPPSLAMEPSAGLLAGMMNLLSLGSGRGAGLRGPNSASTAASIILAPGMSVATQFGQATFKERREADGITVLALPGGATAYVPAAGLAEFVTPPTTTSTMVGKKRRPRSLSALGGVGGASSSTATPNNTAATSPAGAGGGGGFSRRSVSPTNGTGTSSSLLGFIKGAVSGGDAPPPLPPSSSQQQQQQQQAGGAATAEEEGGKKKATSSPVRPPMFPSSPGHDPQQLQGGGGGGGGGGRLRSDSLDSESSTASTGLRGWWARRGGARGPRPLTVGDRVSTGHLGEAVVLRVREDGMVEVAFCLWRGRGFLHKSVVKPC